MTEEYEILCAELKSLTDGVRHDVSNLANAAALLYASLPDVSWAGFYLLENETLVLGPFQGKPACIEIPIGRGVCGTAAVRKETVTVENVHRFPGHIACDSASNSEIVVPLIKDGLLLGVMDLDSTVFGRFTAVDRQGLERFAQITADALTSGRHFDSKGGTV